MTFKVRSTVYCAELIIHCLRVFVEFALQQVISTVHTVFIIVVALIYCNYLVQHNTLPYCTFVAQRGISYFICDS